MSMSTTDSHEHDEQLTATVFGAIQSLSSTRKANLLLDTALALIGGGQYGPEVENYIEVYLRTPYLPRKDVSLIAKAEQDFRAVQKLDPTNRDLQRHLQREKVKIAFAHDPASFIPRYHLRIWLFISPFHREIAVRLIFHTLDLYFAEDQQDALNRGLDVFDRVKADAVFASRIKTLRIHWAYEEGEMLDLMIRIFRSTIPEFKALQTFEWIGYPEMRAELVQTILTTHPHLQCLGLIGWHFDAVGVSAFRSLHKFTLRAEDDDGFADMGEVRAVLDQNAQTLRHLVLGAYLMRAHSWDAAFQSVTIKNLTHLDLVDTRISQLVLARIAQAHGLQSLTLHGSFEAPEAATVVFATDVPSPSDDGAGARNPPSGSFAPRSTRYHALGFLSPALCRAIPSLNICLPVLHFTMEVFQPIDGDLTELYKTTPGLARLLFHTWRLIVEDGGKTDELGHRALTVLLPREFTAEMFASSVEGAGGTLGHVAALIARHIEVFGPRISRRVPGPERLMPIGIHLGVFRTVLLTTNALSKFCIEASNSSSSSTTEDHFGPFIRTLAPALSLPALTKCLKQLGRIPVGEDVGTNKSPWDGALYETLSLLSASLMIDRHGISSALRPGLVPALARCCQRELSGRTATKVAFFVANILGPATMLRSLGKYIKSDREEVAELVAEARAAGEAPQIMDLLDLWCEMADRHLLMLRLRREMDMCAYASVLRKQGHSPTVTMFRLCDEVILLASLSKGRLGRIASHDLCCCSRRSSTSRRALLLQRPALHRPDPARALPRQPRRIPSAHTRHPKQFNEPAVIISDFFRWQPDKRMPFLESFPLGDAQLRERIVKDDPTWDDWVERSWRSDGGLALHVVRLPVGDEWGPYNRYVVYPMRVNV
ncbi:hypothetical protein C8F01DRAFT_1343097 [Mycena amicta]|nr:hypothetical protein C8F01DRAFT_1343097 [Mycena amicta]